MPTPNIKGDFTYDVTTLRGIVRLQSRDKDAQNPVNLDSEVDAMIQMTGSTLSPSGAWTTDALPTVYLAAANYLNLMARDAAKLAIIEKIGAISDNTKVTYDALKEEAQTLRANASQNILPNVGSLTPDPFYNRPWIKLTDTGNGTLSPVSSPLDSW